MAKLLSKIPHIILNYQSEDRDTHTNVRLEGETVWLSKIGLTDLYPTTKQNISLHIDNI